jgi:hypothetical protein
VLYKFDPVSGKPLLQELRLNAKIANQFATTAVTSQVTNPSPLPQDASFIFLIPDNALISNLTMTVDNVVYVANSPLDQTTDQTNCLEAKKDKNSAIVLSVDKVSQKNEVQITTHLQGFQTLTFNLTYEEYILKKNETYSHSLKIASQLFVELVEAAVLIKQSSSIRIAQITTANPACQNIILGVTKTRARVTTKSSLHCPILNFGADGRIHLDLSVQYTLTDNGTHDLVTDGIFFAHFLSSESLKTFPKHLVCITDVSKDLGGNQFQQMQDTLIRIINILTDVDTFQLIFFNSGLSVWPNLYTSLAGTESNKQNAIAFVRRLNAGRGGRDIYKMLRTAIEAASRGNLKPNTKQMVLFLTDGSLVTATEKLIILKSDWRANNGNRIPIHGLAFGNDPDLDIIEMVTKQSQGKAMRLE